MNKKNILILIATIVVAAVVFSFAAANADACKHEHTWDRWTVLEDSHKLIVQCTDCGNNIVDNSKFDSHVFVDGVCKCGKTDPDYKTLDLDLDLEPIEEPEEEPIEEPEEEPLILHEHDYKIVSEMRLPNSGNDYKKVHTLITIYRCSCDDGYSETTTEAHNFGEGTCISYLDTEDNIAGRHTMSYTCKDCNMTYRFGEKHVYPIDMSLCNDRNHTRSGACSICHATGKNPSEDHTYVNGVCSVCGYECKHSTVIDNVCIYCNQTMHVHNYVATESIYDQYKDKYHFITTTMTCSCGDKYYTGLIEEHNYEDYGYLGDGVMHKKQLKCSDCGRYTYDGEEEACDLIQLEAADAEPHEYEGRLYQGFRFKCSICGVEVVNTIDMGPVHVHDMKLEVINDSEYRYTCACGEATDIEVFEWDLIFNNGRNVVYEDAVTGCQKHYAYTRTSVDGNDHKVTVNEYIDNSSSGIIYMNREDYTEPHNIVTTMNLVNYSEWYERCSDCGYEASHAFDWQIKTVEDNKIYFVDANGGPFTKIEVTTYYPMNNGEQHIKFVSDYYYRNGTFIAKTLAEYAEEEHTGADNCDYCGATTDHVYVFKTRVLGISYYECTDCVAHYYRYTTDEGEVLFFDSLFDAVESKLGRELRDREWIIVNHLRETRCETF